MLIVARCLLARRGVDGFLTAALRPERMLLLVLFWVVAVVVTVFMPQILAGRTVVVPFRGEWLARIPLQPSAQNVSQLLYLTASVFAAVAFAALLGTPAMRQHGLKALCLGAAVAVATGLIDFASSFLPIAPLLAPFRTASYALLVSHEVLGAKRVVGLTPEASSFGLLCLGLLTMLYFLRHAIEGERLRRRVVPALIAALATCVWLSTSSAAYVGLILFGLVAGVEWSWRAARGRRAVAAELGVAAAAVAAVIVVVLVAPQLVDRAVAIFDTMVLQKTASSSFHERQTWTVTSWQALIEFAGDRRRGRLDAGVELGRRGDEQHRVPGRAALLRVRAADAAPTGGARRRGGAAAAGGGALGVPAAVRRQPADRDKRRLRADSRVPLRAGGGGGGDAGSRRPWAEGRRAADAELGLAATAPGSG